MCFMTSVLIFTNSKCLRYDGCSNRHDIEIIFTFLQQQKCQGIDLQWFRPQQKKLNFRCLFESHFIIDPYIQNHKSRDITGIMIYSEKSMVLKKKHKLSRLFSNLGLNLIMTLWNRPDQNVHISRETRKKIAGHLGKVSLSIPRNIADKYVRHRDFINKRQKKNCYSKCDKL